jgi:hypothetical protein
MKPAGDFNAYLELKKALYDSVSGTPPLRLESIPLAATRAVERAALDTQGESQAVRAEHVGAALNNAIPEFAREFTAALLQCDVASTQTAAFAARTWTGAELTKLATAAVVGMLRTTTIDDHVLHVLQHKDGPAMGEEVIAGAPALTYDHTVLPQRSHGDRIEFGKRIISATAAARGRGVHVALEGGTKKVRPHKAGDKDDMKSKSDHKDPRKKRTGAGAAGLRDQRQDKTRLQKADGAERLNKRAPKRGAPNATKGSCYKCGQPGHVARECHNQAVRPRCTHCGQWHPDHFSCPKAARGTHKDAEGGGGGGGVNRKPSKVNKDNDKK